MGHRDGATPIVGPTSIARGANSRLKASRSPTMFGVQSMEYLNNAFKNTATEQHLMSIESPKARNPHFQGGTHIHQE